MTTQACPHINEFLDELEIVAHSYTAIARNVRRGHHDPSTVDEGLHHLGSAMNFAVAIRNSSPSGGTSGPLLAIVQSFYEMYLETIRPDPHQLAPPTAPATAKAASPEVQGEASRRLVFTSVLGVLRSAGLDLQDAHRAAAHAAEVAEESAIKKARVIMTH